MVASVRTPRLGHLCSKPSESSLFIQAKPGSKCTHTHTHTHTHIHTRLHIHMRTHMEAIWVIQAQDTIVGFFVFYWWIRKGKRKKKKKSGWVNHVGQARKQHRSMAFTSVSASRFLSFWNFCLGFLWRWTVIWNCKPKRILSSPSYFLWSWCFITKIVTLTKTIMLIGWALFY